MFLNVNLCFEYVYTPPPFLELTLHGTLLLAWNMSQESSHAVRIWKTSGTSTSHTRCSPFQIDWSTEDGRGGSPCDCVDSNSRFWRVDATGSQCYAVDWLVEFRDELTTNINNLITIFQQLLVPYIVSWNIWPPIFSVTVNNSVSLWRISNAKKMSTSTLKIKHSTSCSLVAYLHAELQIHIDSGNVSTYLHTDTHWQWKCKYLPSFRYTYTVEM